MKKILILFFIIITSALMLVSCSSSEQSGKSKANANAKVSETGNNGGVVFTAYDLEGNTRTSTEFAGQPLIVNIWGTWCPPCRMEMPALQQIYDEYKPRGLEIIGLATERRPNNEAGVSSFVNQNGYTWEMWMADSENKAKLGIGGGVPFTVFIDRDGKVVHTHTGLMQYAQFKEYVEKII